MQGKSSLALAYAMKKRKPQMQEASEDMVEDMPPETESKRDRAIRMFNGGQVKSNEYANEQNDRELNQHGEIERGPYGVDEHSHDGANRESYIEHPVENQEQVEDMVGRVMAQRQQEFAKGGEAHMCSGSGCSHYSHGGSVKKMSEGGKVANDDEPIVDSSPNEFDDLALRDDLKSSYTGKDSGDEIGNSELEEDEDDVVSRARKSWSKKDRNPRPA